MKLDFKILQRYGLESIVILLSVIISFYIENQRDLASKKNEKNQLLEDLIETIEEDLKQLINIQEKTTEAVKLINEIQNDINSKNNILTKKEAVSKLLTANVGVSFFPQEGIFNKLISTGSFELIESKELKGLLLKLYDHQNNRNISISHMIDLYSLEYAEKVYLNFRIDFKNNNSEGYIYGKRTIETFNFNNNYYISDELYGILSRGKRWGYQYDRLLGDISQNYKKAKIFAEKELK